MTGVSTRCSWRVGNGLSFLYAAGSSRRVMGTTMWTSRWGCTVGAWGRVRLRAIRFIRPMYAHMQSLVQFAHDNSSVLLYFRHTYYTY